MIRFGMPTLIETSTLADCAALCKELSLDFIELNMNLPQYQTNVISSEHFRDMQKKFGISYTLHLDENLNVCDFNPYVAEAYQKTVLEAIEISKKLFIPTITMHMAKGVYFTLPDRKVFLFEQYQAQYFETLMQFRRQCEAAIGSWDLKICIENTNGYTELQKKAIDFLLESPCFALTFDTGHNQCSKSIDEPFLLNRTEKLCHMHLHDAVEASKKDHMPLGTGELDIAKYLSLAEEKQCSVVLETKTIEGLRKTVQWLNAHR